MKAVCDICPHRCVLEEGQTGFCGARTNQAGRIICGNYGKLTSLALDPIEKKPLACYMPGSQVLSVGSYGCNLRCGFCQNHGISTAKTGSLETVFLSPEALTEKALELKPKGNIGLAYTYNEPLIGYEYVKDCAKLIHKAGLKNILVTNGSIRTEPLAELLPYIHAMNIDLKGFTDAFYKTLCGDLETVRQTILLASRHCHVEVTTLIIPGENDSPSEMEALSGWLASVNPDIPYHISRFFPRHQYRDRSPTPVKTVYDLVKIAGKHLNRVFTGNC
jgi:pyruvate formate lyase activating enzyme